MKKGLLITFEGTEGAGKSTLIRKLVERLKATRTPALVTREPGGSPLGEKIRDVILNHSMHPMTELFLYEASRSEHVVSTILPALEAGKVVLCDRYTDSSLAYQAHARGLNWSLVHKLNQIATHKVRPDLKVFLEIQPEAGLKRAQDGNRFEAEGVAFQEKVRKGFLKSMKMENGKRWLRIQVDPLTPDEVCQRVYTEIEKKLKKRNSQFYGKKKKK